MNFLFGKSSKRCYENSISNFLQKINRKKILRKTEIKSNNKK